MTNNEMFFNLYNILDDQLRKYYNIDNLNTSVIIKRINELKDSPSNLDKERGDKLDIVRNLRNSLAHVERFDNKDNFIIKTSLIKFLKQEIALIKKPPRAIDICKKIEQVYWATLDSNVEDVSKTMLQKGYTHVPILQDGYLYGVFSENTIFSHFVKNKYLNQDSSITLRYYDSYLDIYHHDTECFAFVSIKRKVTDLMPMFANKKDGKRLAMIFVTKNGQENEKIIGIITYYDLF